MPSAHLSKGATKGSAGVSPAFALGKSLIGAYTQHIYSSRKSKVSSSL